MTAALITVMSTGLPKPNVIVLFADDWGYGDLGANDDAAKGLTPHMDALAESGIRFTDFHAGASVCTPSRAALLTGRLGLRTGVTHNFGPPSAFGLPREEVTIAALLKQQTEYSTHMIGKYHLGTTPGYSPTYHGFDEYFGLPYSDDMGCVDRVWPNHPMDPTCAANASEATVKWPLPLYLSTTNCSGQTTGDCNGDIVEQPAKLETLSSRYAAFAEKVFSKAADSKTPFFLYVAFAHMHAPQFCADPYLNRTGRGHFADALAELDDTIGAMMGSLRAHGLRNSTLVLMTGDNGPWQEKCDLTGSTGPFHGTWQQRNGGGSSAKTTLWEAGHREPGLASWPGVIAPGRLSAALTSTLDYLPTIAALAGASLPTDRAYDGVDLTPVLLGASEVAHASLFHPNSGASGPNGALDAVRHHNYKAVWQTGGAKGCRDGRTSDPAPSLRHEPPLLFDLDADPAEASPLNTTAFAEVLETIRALRHAKEESINTTFRSVTDYAQDDKFKPCCNRTNVACRCEEAPEGNADGDASDTVNDDQIVESWWA